MVVKYGKILKVDEKGVVLVEVPLGQHAYIVNRQDIGECEVRFKDGRNISPEQRKFVYSLLGSLSEYMGEDIGATKQTMKEGFACKAGISSDFSLSDMEMSTANLFIDFLIGIIMDNEISTKYPLSEMCGDVGRYIYACCIKNHCCIFNQPAKIINISRPNLPVQKGDAVLPLCPQAEHELKSVGLKDFCKKNHVRPIKADSFLVLHNPKNTQENDDEGKSFL